MSYGSAKSSGSVSESESSYSSSSTSASVDIPCCGDCAIETITEMRLTSEGETWTLHDLTQSSNCQWNCQIRRESDGYL